jgi:hypothetical protein
MLAAAAAIACLPALGQNQDGKRDGPLEQARQIAVLVEAGQARASTAAQLAEAHTNGTALSVISKLAGAADQQAGEKDGTIDQKVIYEIRCLDQSKKELQTVLVDGRTRKVRETDAPTKAKPAP